MLPTSPTDRKGRPCLSAAAACLFLLLQQFFSDTALAPEVPQPQFAGSAAVFAAPSAPAAAGFGAAVVIAATANANLVVIGVIAVITAAVSTTLSLTKSSELSSWCDCSEHQCNFDASLFPHRPHAPPSTVSGAPTPFVKRYEERVTISGLFCLRLGNRASPHPLRH